MMPNAKDITTAQKWLLKHFGIKAPDEEAARLLLSIKGASCEHCANRRGATGALSCAGWGHNVVLPDGRGFLHVSGVHRGQITQEPYPLAADILWKGCCPRFAAMSANGQPGRFRQRLRSAWRILRGSEPV